MTVIASFFRRISGSIPFFGLLYYASTWLFLIVYGLFFVYIHNNRSTLQNQQQLQKSSWRFSDSNYNDYLDREMNEASTNRYASDLDDEDTQLLQMDMLT